MDRKPRTRNEKIFYVISILIVISMLLSMIYVAILPN
jgi:cell division protein FtsL